MALLLREHDVGELLRMEDALEAVEEAFRQQGLGRVVNVSRERVHTPRSSLHLMAAALPYCNAMGYKAYTVHRERLKFIFLLYSTETAELLAMIEADKLGQMRTGAASGIATRYLARADASQVGIFGTGWQARTQVEAVCKVRPIRRVHAYSRNPDHRVKFCREMETLLRVEVRPVDDPRQVLAGADILITATTSAEPLFDGDWLPAGAHVNAIGANSLIRRELDQRTVERADLVVVDSRAQARKESGELFWPIEGGSLSWEQVRELGDLVARAEGRRQAQDITLFKSLGVALEDVAVGQRVYELARSRGMGEEVGFS